MEQRTEIWFSARLGRVTASRIADLMAKTKSGPSTSRDNYLAQLVSERLTGTSEPGYVNAAMQHGIDNEAAARECYCFAESQTAVEVGFIEHPTIGMAGASPDGLVGENGLIEIKAPNPATHLRALRGSPIDDKYIKQMQFQMACTGRQWCDFVSYDPRMPVEMQLHVRRVERDDDLIAKIEEEVTAFLAEVEATVTDLNTRYRKAA